MTKKEVFAFYLEKKLIVLVGEEIFVIDLLENDVNFGEKKSYVEKYLKSYFLLNYAKTKVLMVLFPFLKSLIF